MGELRECIKNEALEEKLYAYILREEPSDDKARLEKRNKRVQTFESYRNKHISKYRTESDEGHKSRRMKRITYDGTLPVLMRMAELDGRGLFALIDMEVPWPGEDFEELAMLCDAMPLSELQSVQRAAMDLSTDWWRSEEIADLQPTVRALTVYRRIVPYAQRRASAPEDLRYSNGDYHNTTTLPVTSFPEVAAYLHISPHWLMKFPNDIPFLGRRPETDNVLDAYSFMPPVTRGIFLEAVRLQGLPNIPDLPELHVDQMPPASEQADEIDGIDQADGIDGLDEINEIDEIDGLDGLDEE